MMVLHVFAACSKAPAATPTEAPVEVTAPASDVAMQYISPADALAVLEDDSYIFFDVRKAADYAVSHIPGALGYDMTKVYTLEGGFTAWSEAYPTNVEPVPAA